MNSKRDVFISYHTSTCRALVEQIVSTLEGGGISCWYAPRDCEDQWAKVIIEAIDNASIFLVLINDEAQNSEHVQNEINAAFSRYKDQKLVIIVFKVDDSAVNANTEYYLGRIHMVNGFTLPLEDRIKELVYRISYTKSNLSRKKELSLESRFESVSVHPYVGFVGRERELSELHEKLSDSGKVFISGMGGLGKSELAKKYIHTHSASYRSVMYGSYSGSLKELVTDDRIVRISNFFRNPKDESDDSYYSRKLDFIRKSGISEDILIIDDFNNAEDAELNDILELPISVLFTTRHTFPELCTLSLGVIEDIEELLEIFKKNYPRALSPEDLEDLKKIFKVIGNHTLSINIISKMMRDQRLSPKRMLEKLEAGLEGGASNQKDINNMISSLYEMSDTSEDEKHILANMLLVPLEGISAEDLFEFCELDSYEQIDSLILKNWIVHDPIRDYVSLHPIINRTVKKKLGYSDERCGRFIENVLDVIRTDINAGFEVKDKIFKLLNVFFNVVPETSRYHEKIYISAARCYHFLSKHRKLIEIMERLLASSPSPKSEVFALTSIADAYRCLEDPENILLYAERALERSAVLDPSTDENKKLISEIYGRFGWGYCKAGEFEKSLEYFTRQLELVIDTPSLGVLDVGWCYHNLGTLLCQMGRYDDALAEQAKSISCFEQKDYAFGIACAQRAVAKCYMFTGRYEESVEILKKCLESFIALVGEEHNDVAFTRHHIAQNYRRMGQPELAMTYDAPALEHVKSRAMERTLREWLNDIENGL